MNFRIVKTKINPSKRGRNVSTFEQEMHTTVIQKLAQFGGSKTSLFLIPMFSSRVHYIMLMLQYLHIKRVAKLLTFLL